MNENNIKALFPEGVETITISKNDYDRLFGELSYKNIYLQSKIGKAIEYIEKYLKEHIIEDQPDEQSIFYDEKGYYIPNAKEQLLSILKEDK